MEINRVAFGALGMAGIMAAGGGAYLANRHNGPAQLQPVAYSQPSEGIVTETENAVVAAPAPAAKIAPQQLDSRVDRSPAPRAQRPTPRPAAARTSTPARQTPARAPEVATRETAPSYTPVPAEARAPAAPTAGAESYERTALPEAPRKIYDELVIPADSVIGLQVEDAVTSEGAKVEDLVRARVTRDVRVRDQVAIPAGSRAEGAITLVDRGGRLKEKARLGIRFHTLVLADGTRVPINTDTIYREGESPARESAAKIGGGAVGGAVLGAIFGGRKGAVIGSTVGAAGGGVAVATSEPNEATLPAGSTVTVRMGSPATVTVER